MIKEFNPKLIILEINGDMFINRDSLLGLLDLYPRDVNMVALTELIMTVDFAPDVRQSILNKEHEIMENPTPKTPVQPQSRTMMMEVTQQGQETFTSQERQTFAHEFHALAPVCNNIKFNFKEKELDILIYLKIMADGEESKERHPLTAGINLTYDMIGDVIKTPEQHKQVVEMVAHRIYIDLTDGAWLSSMNAESREVMAAIKWLKENYPVTNLINNDTGMLPLAERLIAAIENEEFETQSGLLTNYQSWQDLKELIRSHYPEAQTEEKFNQTQTN